VLRPMGCTPTSRAPPRPPAASRALLRRALSLLDATATIEYPFPIDWQELEGIANAATTTCASTRVLGRNSSTSTSDRRALRPALSSPRREPIRATSPSSSSLRRRRMSRASSAPAAASIPLLAPLRAACCRSPQDVPTRGGTRGLTSLGGAFHRRSNDAGGSVAGATAATTRSGRRSPSRSDTQRSRRHTTNVTVR